MEALKDERILRVLKLPEEDEAAWRVDLDRFERGDLTLTRKSVGESSGTDHPTRRATARQSARPRLRARDGQEHSIADRALKDLLQKTAG